MLFTLKDLRTFFLKSGHFLAKNSHKMEEDKVYRAARGLFTNLMNSFSSNQDPMHLYDPMINSAREGY